MHQTLSYFILGQISIQQSPMFISCSTEAKLIDKRAQGFGSLHFSTKSFSIYCPSFLLNNAIKVIKKSCLLLDTWLAQFAQRSLWFTSVNIILLLFPILPISYWSHFVIPLYISPQHGIIFSAMIDGGTMLLTIHKGFSHVSNWKRIFGGFDLSPVQSLPWSIYCLVSFYQACKISANAFELFFDHAIWFYGLQMSIYA